MAKVVPFRRPARPTAELEEEAGSRRQLRVHVTLFSAIALVMYTVAILSVPSEIGDELWMVWLVLVIAVSKLALANGLFLAVWRRDKREVDRATRATRLRRSSGRRRVNPDTSTRRRTLHSPWRFI